MDFNSKYTGQQVEALLDIVSQGGSSGGEGGTITEAELLAMGFTKNLGTITEVKMNGASKGTSGVVDLGNVITEHQDIRGKQDLIEDLDAIREGASLGATALQSIPSEYVTETELTAKGYATTSQLSGKQDIITDLATIRSNASKGASALQSIPSEYITETELTAKDYATTSQLSSKQDTISDLATIRSGASKGATAVQPSSLASVATSGSYNDLTNKPTIPSAVTESTVSGWGFTKNSGTYSKPSTGIPKTDLASAVQTSLNNADTAYQKPSTGIPVTDFKESVRTELTRIGEVTNGYSGLNAISTAIGNKQDKLVSGTNIKTINGQSLLGSGNITIEGGTGGSSSGESKEIVTTHNSVIENLEPNKIYIATPLSGQLTIESIEYPYHDQYAEYSVIICLDALSNENMSLVLPSDVMWANGMLPDTTKYATYELSIVYWNDGGANGFNAVLTPFDFV